MWGMNWEDIAQKAKDASSILAVRKASTKFSGLPLPLGSFPEFVSTFLSFGADEYKLHLCWSKLVRAMSMAAVA